MQAATKYLFMGILLVMGLVLTLRFIDRIPLWVWPVFCVALGVVYWLYKKWRKF